MRAAAPRTAVHPVAGHVPTPFCKDSAAHTTRPAAPTHAIFHMFITIRASPRGLQLLDAYDSGNTQQLKVLLPDTDSAETAEGAGGSSQARGKGGKKAATAAAAAAAAAAASSAYGEGAVRVGGGSGGGGGPQVDALRDALERWRVHVARGTRVFPHCVLSAEQLEALSALAVGRAVSEEEVAGAVGARRYEMYGKELMDVLHGRYVPPEVDEQLEHHVGHEQQQQGARVGALQSGGREAGAAGGSGRAAGGRGEQYMRQRQQEQRQQVAGAEEDDDVILVDDSDGELGEQGGAEGQGRGAGAAAGTQGGPGRGARRKDSGAAGRSARGGAAGTGRGKGRRRVVVESEEEDGEEEWGEDSQEEDDEDDFADMPLSKRSRK